MLVVKFTIIGIHFRVYIPHLEGWDREFRICVPCMSIPVEFEYAIDTEYSKCYRWNLFPLSEYKEFAQIFFV